MKPFKTTITAIGLASVLSMSAQAANNARVSATITETAGVYNEYQDSEDSDTTYTGFLNPVNISATVTIEEDETEVDDATGATTYSRKTSESKLTNATLLAILEAKSGTTLARLDGDFYAVGKNGTKTVLTPLALELIEGANGISTYTEKYNADGDQVAGTETGSNSAELTIPLGDDSLVLDGVLASVSNGSTVIYTSGNQSQSEFAVNNLVNGNLNSFQTAADFNASVASFLGEITGYSDEDVKVKTKYGPKTTSRVSVLFPANLIKLGAGNVAVKWSAQGLPAGLSISSSTGVISGTVKAVPSDASVDVTITATTEFGSVDKDIVLTVIP